MSETRRTITFIGIAVVLALLSVFTAPKRITPNAFLDQGELFFPDFEDPNEATTLEVIDFNSETGSAVPFKVTFRRGMWTIPSHHNHPADGQDRLAKTAAGVIGIRKDDFRSDNVADHKGCGVIDPLDETATSFEGRGQRVTLKDKHDIVLADFIIGNEVEGSEGYRFVRVPGHKRVYAAKIDVDISTEFADWIESDLLQVTRDKIERLVTKDYSIDERTGRLMERGEVVLQKDGNRWSAADQRANEEVDMTTMNQLLGALDDLKIVGIRPKPKGLTTTLTRSSDSLQVSTADMLSLQNAGYFFTRDGRLVSNEGELQVGTTEGIVYTLRFGEIVYGSGLAVSAGAQTDEGGNAPGENRYLFITSRFDEAAFPEPQPPANTDFLAKADSTLTNDDLLNRKLYKEHGKWREKQNSRSNISTRLNGRFAGWYYVITADSFDKLRLTRSDLVKPSPEG